MKADSTHIEFIFIMALVLLGGDLFPDLVRLFSNKRASSPETTNFRLIIRGLYGVGGAIYGYNIHVPLWAIILYLLLTITSCVATILIQSYLRSGFVTAPGGSQPIVTSSSRPSSLNHTELMFTFVSIAGVQLTLRLLGFNTLFSIPISFIFACISYELFNGGKLSFPKYCLSYIILASTMAVIWYK
jgi:hypothetical protein